MRSRAPAMHATCFAALLSALAAPPAPAAAAQDPVPQADLGERVERLETQNAELSRRLDVVLDEMERERLGPLVAPVGESEHGLGPAASKVYGAGQGVTLGGYGEVLYQNREGATDMIDFVRAVLYVGYKFDDKWIFNSEIEVEHTDEIFLEFAYLDYLHRPEASFRGGLVLVPMGFLNELHEPTTFYSAQRPVTETVLLPSTWRENGVGLFGEACDFQYRTYVVNGFDAEGFSATGLRGGRQKGGQAKADDFAWVGRADWTGAPGLMVGGSAYVGDAGQDLGPDVSTTIWEGHAEYRWRGMRARALYAMAELDDVDDLNMALGLTGDDSVGEELTGGYLELGWDVLAMARPGSRQQLIPFVRREWVDTQAEVPSGFASDPANDMDIRTYGVDFFPIDQVVLKVDFRDVDDDAGGGTDQWNVSLGYIF